MKLKITAWILASILLSSVPALAGLNQTQVSQLYVSIFGRASEGEGNAFWQSQPDMATAAAAMLDTQAAKDYFGANLNTNQAFIEHIYQNTLNKTIADDFDGISYWVNMLNAGTSRGEAVAALVGVIKEYAPGAQYYNPNDAATIAAYKQFTNRVEISNYMADNVWDTPGDWQTSTSFSYGMKVTDDPASIIAAMVIVNGFTEDPVLLGSCGAYLAPGVWKEFDCYNLAAIGKTTGDDPFTPSWRLIGGYWQWGRKGPDPSVWYDTNTEHFAHGPTGPGEDEANEGEISGWRTTYAPDGSWSDSEKTANDPCPDGYRVPTITQWEGVADNNPQSTVGTWASDDKNYSSARFFGNDLMLPAPGNRHEFVGSLYARGGHGGYWSSTTEGAINSNEAWNLRFSSVASPYSGSWFRKYGWSLRCIAEDESSNVILSKTEVTLSNGGTEIISISGGTGNYSVSSDYTGIATAVLNGMNVAITGISNGAATITVEDTGGSSATIAVTVTSATGICGAYVAPGVWKEFDCYNLAAIGKTTGDDPFTPSWRLIGGYWQWGRKGPDSSQWYDTNTKNFAHGPIGPGDSEANEGEISIWNDTYAPDGAWSDSYKTSNDPCPSGYRVPTDLQWRGVNENNTQSTVGTWDSDKTNYSSARIFGNSLMLPAAGLRIPSGSSKGSLTQRGHVGYYWASTQRTWYGEPEKAGHILHFEQFYIRPYFLNHSYGFSVRCIAE